MSRVVLALSGGVDSSVAGWLLQKAGYEVTGVYIRTARPLATPESPVAPSDGCGREQLVDDAAADLDDDAAGSEAVWLGDAAAASRSAERLGIPLQVISLENEFRSVIDYFVDEYAAGRTPNPCAVCNATIKFGALFDYARSIGAERLATGHHARIVHANTSNVSLCRGRDPGKDQSYFLFGIDRRVLSKLIFPIGDYSKADIRRMAAEIGLKEAAQAPDSQDICFVSQGEHVQLVRQALAGRGQDATANRDGPVVTVDGKVVGRHDGVERFTVGQRKGIGIALGQPHYVIRIEPETQTVVLGTREQLARRELTARGVNWLEESIAKLSAGETFRAEVKIRYRSRPLPATVRIISPDEFRVRFDEPCYGIAPGQAAVCYRGDTVLGGGWIE